MLFHSVISCTTINAIILLVSFTLSSPERNCIFKIILLTDSALVCNYIFTYFTYFTCIILWLTILIIRKSQPLCLLLYFFDGHGSVHRTRIFKYNQQDAMLHKLFISVKRSTCFRRFIRPSSGAQKLYIQHRVLCQTFSATCHDSGR